MRPLTDEQRTQIMHYFPPRLGDFPIPTAGILDAPYYCLIINVEWIGHLIGVLDALDQLDAWIGTSEQIDNARQEVRKLITAINPCEDSNLVFRQNPENLCQLEQSVDGGINWTLAFDYSLCLPQASSTEIINNIGLGSTGIEELRDQFDGTPGSIAPNAVASPNLEDLLCYAIDMLVRTTCEVAADNQEEDSRMATILAGVMGVIAVALAVPTGGASIAIYGVAISAALVGVASVLLSISADILRDTEAQDKVICCMNEALQGSGLTQAEFEASLGGCSFTVGSDEYILAQAFSNMLDDQDVYLAFLNFMENTDPFFNAGLFTCPCEDEWCYTFDFTIDDGDWAPGGANPRGEWLTGVGWSRTAYEDDSCGIYIVRDFAETVITRVDVEFDLNSDNGNRKWTLFIVNNGSSVGTPPINGNSNGLDQTKTATGTWTCDNLQMKLDTRNSVCNPADVAIVKSIKLWGTGENPFGEDNC
jgi:hypothetical protein